MRPEHTEAGFICFSLKECEINQQKGYVNGLCLSQRIYPEKSRLKCRSGLVDPSSHSSPCKWTQVVKSAVREQRRYLVIFQILSKDLCGIQFIAQRVYAAYQIVTDCAHHAPTGPS